MRPPRSHGGQRHLIPRTRPRLAAAGVALGLLAGCTSSPRPEGAAGAPTLGPACLERKQTTLPGYAMTGDVFHATLRRLTLCPVALGAAILRTGVDQQRVSWLTGAGGQAIVAESATGVDTLALVGAERLEAIPLLGNPPGHSPALAPDGRLAFIARDTATNPPGFLLRVFDPATNLTTTLLRRTLPLSSPSWGPRGALAALDEDADSKPRLLVFDQPAAATTAPRRLGHLPGSAVGVLWLPSGDFAITLLGRGGAPGRALVLRPDGRELGSLPFPWQPLGVVPGGGLLAGRNDTGQLARFDRPSYAEPIEFGRLPAGEAVWQVVVP